MYLSVAVLGLCCCARALSSCCEWGLLFTVVHGFLIAVASLVSKHRFWACGLQYLWHMGLIALWCVESS